MDQRLVTARQDLFAAQIALGWKRIAYLTSYDGWVYARSAKDFHGQQQDHVPGTATTAKDHDSHDAHHVWIHVL